MLESELSERKQKLGLIVGSVYMVFGFFLVGLTFTQGLELDVHLEKMKSHNLCS